MKDTLSPRQVAQAIGVSEASLKRWCDRGLLPARRTAGGHRRLPIDGVIRFLRDSGHPLIKPEVLGLPSNTGLGDLSYDRAEAQLQEALRAGDEAQVRSLLVNLFLAGRSVRDLADRVIAPAFDALGSIWQHGGLEVYQERRGCEIMLRSLYEIRSMLPPPAQSGHLAIGGTLEHDPYTLPTTIVEVVLQEVGWRAESLGSGNPADTLAAAIRERRPKLFWLSVSTIDNPGRFLASYAIIAKAASDLNVPIAVGGRALTETIRAEMEYACFGDNMRHLAGYVSSLASKGNSAVSIARTSASGA